MEAVTRTFEFEGHRLVYDEYGSGDKLVLLMPALLFSRRMHGPLAQELAARGNRVLCLDLLGHGDSERPPEMSSYSMATFGRQAIGLLDHLGIDAAHFLGLSLGGFVGQWLGIHAPSRIDHLVLAHTSSYLGPAAPWDARIADLTQQRDAAKAAIGLRDGSAGDARTWPVTFSSPRGCSVCWASPRCRCSSRST